MEKFNVNNEPTVLSLSWPKWKRGIITFLKAKKIDDPELKTSLMLHCAGLDVQEIFETLPKDDSEENVDVFEAALNRLSKYFVRKVNVDLEKSIFRQMVQERNESIGQFVLRLRQQGSRCDFGTALDSNIREQLIYNCFNKKLKGKVLEKGNVSLDEIVLLGQSLEALEDHVQTEGKRKSDEYDEINNINKKRRFTRFNERPRFPAQLCFRCGSRNHLQQNSKCPALGKTCTKCGLKNHFFKFCKTKNIRPQKGTIRSVIELDREEVATDDTNQNETDAEYIFAINSTKKINSAIVEVKIGGIPIMVLIDSGADANIIGGNIWSDLKKKKIKLRKQKKGSSKILKVFGGEQLEVIGEIEVEVVTKRSECVITTFYVVKNAGQTIICRDTAIELKLLTLGYVNQVNSY